MIEKKIKKRKKEENVGYLLVMPAMLLIVCFFAVTFVSNLITSFTISELHKSSQRSSIFHSSKKHSNLDGMCYNLAVFDWFFSGIVMQP